MTDSKRCYVCDTPVKLAETFLVEECEQHDVDLDVLTVDQQDAYVERLGLVDCKGPAEQFLDDGRTLVCRACHAIGMVSATGHIKPTLGLLEWVWREVCSEMQAMLLAWPKRGFSGDDGYDDFRGCVAAMNDLHGAYFDDDLTTFGLWLDEGPQYMEIRLRLRHEAGLPEDD